MSRTPKQKQCKRQAIPLERLLEAPPARPVVFKVHAPPQSRVFLAGTFNKWNAQSTHMATDGNGGYAIRLLLTPGKYEYKFVINGEWFVDPTNGHLAPNGVGSLNSVAQVI